MHTHSCLTINGVILDMKVSDGIWAEMHNLREHYIPEKVFEVLKKFGQPITIFNTSVMKKYEYLPMPKYWSEIAKKVKQ